MFIKSLILALLFTFASPATAGPVCRKTEIRHWLSCEVQANFGACYRTCKWYLTEIRRKSLYIQVEYRTLKKLEFMAALARSLGESLLKNDWAEDRQRASEYIDYADRLDLVRDTVQATSLW